MDVLQRRTLVGFPQTEEYRHGDFVPDGIVVNLGTNDYSRYRDMESGETLCEQIQCTESHLSAFRLAFTSKYAAFLLSITVDAGMPNLPVFCAAGPIDGEKYGPWVRHAMQDAGTKGAKSLYFLNFSTAKQDGCANHPGYVGHAQMFEKAEPIISYVLKWSHTSAPPTTAAPSTTLAPSTTEFVIVPMATNPVPTAPTTTIPTPTSQAFMSSTPTSQESRENPSYHYVVIAILCGGLLCIGWISLQCCNMCVSGASLLWNGIFKGRSRGMVRNSMPTKAFDTTLLRQTSEGPQSQQVLDEVEEDPLLSNDSLFDTQYDDLSARS